MVWSSRLPSPQALASPLFYSLRNLPLSSSPAFSTLLRKWRSAACVPSASCSFLHRLLSTHPDLRTGSFHLQLHLQLSFVHWPFSFGCKYGQGSFTRNKNPKAAWPQSPAGPFVFSSECLVGVVFACPPLIAPHWADPADSPAPVGVCQALLQTHRWS